MNPSLRRVEGFRDAIHENLAALDGEFEWGLVGTTIAPVRYIDLPHTHDEQLGYQLMLSFWAWGDSEAEVMDNLDRVVSNIGHAMGEAVRGDQAAVS